MRPQAFIQLLVLMAFIQVAYSQPTEKFLKLTRIITIDTMRTVNRTGEADLAFQFSVPSNVYWRVDYIQFSNDLDGGFIWHDFLVKLRYAFLRQIESEKEFNDQNITGPDPKIFIRKSPLWLQPGRQITFYVRWDQVEFNGPSDKFNLILNAHEFLLE